MSENEEITSALAAAQATHHLVAEIQAEFVATRIGIISIIEQLVASGRVDAREAADRMTKIASSLHDLTEEAIQAVELFRKQIEVIAESRQRKPPQLHIVPQEI